MVRWSDDPMVRWSDGLLIRWSDGLLIRWSDDPMVCCEFLFFFYLNCVFFHTLCSTTYGRGAAWSDDPMVCWSDGPMIRWSDDLMVMLIRWSADPMVRWSDGLLIRWSDGLLIRWSDDPMSWSLRKTIFFYLKAGHFHPGKLQVPSARFIYMYTDTDRNIQRVLLFRLLSWLVSSNWFVHICFKQLLLYWQEKPKQKQQSQKGEPPEVEALSDAMEFRWDDGLTWGAMIRVDSARTFRLLYWIYKFLFFFYLNCVFLNNLCSTDRRHQSRSRKARKVIRRRRRRVSDAMEFFDGMMGSREVLMISRTGWIIERFPPLFAVFTYFFYLICILLPMGWFQKPYNTHIYICICV